MLVLDGWNCCGTGSHRFSLMTFWRTSLPLFWRVPETRLCAEGSADTLWCVWFIIGWGRLMLSSLSIDVVAVAKGARTESLGEWNFLRKAHAFFFSKCPFKKPSYSKMTIHAVENKPVPKSFWPWKPWQTWHIKDGHGNMMDPCTGQQRNKMWMTCHGW